MRLYLIVISLATLNHLNEAKLTLSKTSKSKPSQNAIIAIQIIDPNENTTNAKNSKRTIESSLGYGYQENYAGPPKYEIYKYSQHDIPPYNPSQYTVQAPSYHTPSTVPKPVQNAGISHFYQPGTILFSTINQQGQLGELSSQFPSSLENHQYPIPVIILRVHPDQLANPLYAKLPQSHLHASAINSIDINSLLSNYIGSSVKQKTVVQQQPIVQQQSIVQQQPIAQHQSSVYQQQQQEYENGQAYVQPQPEAVQYQSNDYQSNDYQSNDYQSQQYYPQYQYEESQDVTQSQNYQAQQDTHALPEPRTPDTSADYQYSNYQVPSPVYQQPSVSVGNYKTELLTDENYPSDKHTQVIFKRSKGKSSTTRNRHSHRSAPQTPSTKSRVSSHNTQPQSDDQAGQHTPKYYQQNANYYTIQYSDDQGYTHQKASSYGVKEQNDQPDQSRNYVYSSAGSTYNQHV